MLSFIVSPSVDSLFEIVRNFSLSLLPGVTTLFEIIHMLSLS